MRLYILRHALTDHNVQRRFQGRGTDIELNEEGLRQAQKTAYYFKNIDLDVIYVSPLKRTLQTANIINKYHNKKIEIENLIIERDFGLIEGRKYNDIDFYEIHKKDLYDYYKIENQIVFQKRIMKFFNQLHEKHFGKNVLIVSHGGVIKMLFSNLQNIPWKKAIYEIKKDNSAISIIEIDEFKRVKSIEINKTSHLD
jgi:broad specificity phosphatase PhoE